MSAKIKLYSEVALTRAVPEHGLCRGDVATVVEFLPRTAASHGEDGCVIEVFNAVGESFAIVALPLSSVEPLKANEILSVRPLSPAH